jgi:sterol 14-demethylase
MVAENATFSPLVRFLLAPSQWDTNPPQIPAIVAGLAVVLMSAFFLRSTKGDKIYDVGGIPVLTAWGFFKRRFDFLQRHFEKTGGMMFRFRVLQGSAKFLCHLRLLITSNYSIE